MANREPAREPQAEVRKEQPAPAETAGKEPEQQPPKEPEKAPDAERGKEETLLPEEIGNADSLQGVPQDTMRIPAYLLGGNVEEKRQIRDREVRRAAKAPGKPLSKKEKRREIILYLTTS